MVTVENAEQDWKLVIEFVYIAVSIILGQRIIWDEVEERIEKGNNDEDYFHLRVDEMKKVNQILDNIVDQKHHNIYLYLYTIAEEGKGQEEDEEEEGIEKRKGMEEDSKADIEAYEEHIQVLERWHLRFSRNGMGRKDSLISNTHKKASVVLRTLYSQMKYLPAYKLYNHNKLIRNGAQKIRFKLLTHMHDQLERCQHGVKMEEASLTSIESSVSDIKCVVKYKERVYIPKQRRTLLSSQRIHQDYLGQEAAKKKKQQQAEFRQRTMSMPPKFVPKNSPIVNKKAYDDTYKPSNTPPNFHNMIKKQKPPVNAYESSSLPAPHSMPPIMRNSPHPRIQQPPQPQQPKTSKNNPWGNSPHMNPPLSHHTTSSVESTNSDISFQSTTPPFQYAGSLKSLPPKKSLINAFDSPTMNVMQPPYSSSSAPRPHGFEGYQPQEQQYSSSVVPSGAFIGEHTKKTSNNPYLNEKANNKVSRLKTRKPDNLTVDLDRIVDGGTFQPRIMPTTPLSGDPTSTSPNMMDELSLSFGNSADNFVPFGEDEDDDGVDGLYKAINNAKRSYRFHNIYGQSSNHQLGVTLDSTLASLRNIHTKYLREIAPSFDTLS